MLKPGEDIDSWCGTCKMILAHTIEAMVGEKPARVHCNTCSAQHNYRPNKPGEGKRTTTPREGTGVVRQPKVRATQYQKLLSGKNMALAKRYSAQETFVLGDVVDHPSFGVGVTTAVKDGAKVEVAFEDVVRVLIHGRQGEKAPRPQ